MNAVGTEFLRGARKILCSYAFLREFMLCQRVNPGERICSNLPTDLEIIGIRDKMNINGDVFAIIATSAEWEPVPPYEDFPEFKATFHREGVQP